MTPVKQGESPTAYARMLDKHLGNIDWNQSAKEIERLIRGTDTVAERIYNVEWKNNENLECRGGRDIGRGRYLERL